MTEKLTLAFEELLRMIGEEPPSTQSGFHDEVGLLEAGLAPGVDEEEDVFENALENFNLGEEKAT